LPAVYLATCKVLAAISMAIITLYVTSVGDELIACPMLDVQGASIPAVRPGRRTAEYITDTLMYMSVLGSVFLGLLAVRVQRAASRLYNEIACTASRTCPHMIEP
jgi:preprotein translocase subunit SecY